MVRTPRAPLKKARQRNFIRAWRTFRGITTLEKFVERLEVQLEFKVSVSQLSRIESGEQEYRQDMLEAFATVLRCSPADLIMRDPTADDPLWSVWEGVRPEDRKQALAVLKTFAGKSGTGG